MILYPTTDIPLRSRLRSNNISTLGVLRTIRTVPTQKCTLKQRNLPAGKKPESILQVAWWAPGQVWMGGKSRPHRDSIPNRPARSSVAIPTELPSHYEGFYKGQIRGQPVHLGANCKEGIKLKCVTTLKETTFVIYIFVQPGRIRMAEREL